MEEKVYFIYLTINNVNGKMYIGQHSCSYEEQFKDGYLGSGKILRHAIQKYGAENFERIILEYANSPDELNDLELKYANEEVMNDERFYNMKTGGMQNAVFSEEIKKKISESRKGQKLTEETKRKLSQSQLGRHHSEETKKKISDSHKNPSEETRRKIGEAHKGIKLSDEVKEKISNAQKGENSAWFGRHHDEETKRKISKKNKGRRLSEETRNRLKESWDYDKHVTDEFRRKMSESQKERWKEKGCSDETRQKLREASLGKHPTEETKQKISDTLKGKGAGEKNPMYGKKHSEETRKKISEARKAYCEKKRLENNK